MHDVHTEVAGPGHTHQGVHVGAVHVDQGVHAVQQIADLLEAVLENADGVGIGDHGARDLAAQFAHKGLQALAHLAIHRIGHVLKADGAIRARGQLHHFVARHGGRGGVGAVATVRDQDHAALGALGYVIGADEHDPRQLTGGARAGLQGDARQPSDFLQPFL